MSKGKPHLDDTLRKLRSGARPSATEKERYDSLEIFFRWCYERAAQLDDPTLKNDDDVPRALMGIRAAARVGYFDVTGKWLSPLKNGGQ